MRRLVEIALEIAESIESNWGAVRQEVRMWAGMYGKTFDQVRETYEHRLKVIAADGPRPPSHDSPERIRQQIDHFAAIKGVLDEIAQGKATSKNVGLLRSSAEALQRMWAKSEKPASPYEAIRTSGPNISAPSSRPAKASDRPASAQAVMGTGGAARPSAAQAASDKDGGGTAGPASNAPTPTPSDPLEPVIAALLRRIPETWTTYSPDDLTQTQLVALSRLVECGLTQYRGRQRLCMANHPLAVEIRFTMTGPWSSSMNAFRIKDVLPAVWPDWAAAYAEWDEGPIGHMCPVQGPMRHLSPVRVEWLPPCEWRLTVEGAKAREQLAGEDAKSRQLVFDLVLRRGIHDGRHPWVDGNVYDFGLPPAQIYLDRLEKVKVDAVVAGTVNVSNWDEGANAFAKAFKGIQAETVAGNTTAAHGETAPPLSAAVTAKANGAASSCGPPPAQPSRDRPKESWRGAAESPDIALRTAHAEELLACLRGISSSPKLPDKNSDVWQSALKQARKEIVDEIQARRRASVPRPPGDNERGIDGKNRAKKQQASMDREAVRRAEAIYRERDEGYAVAAQEAEQRHKDATPIRRRRAEVLIEILADDIDRLSGFRKYDKEPLPLYQQAMVDYGPRTHANVELLPTTIVPPKPLLAAVVEDMELICDKLKARRDHAALAAAAPSSGQAVVQPAADAVPPAAGVTGNAVTAEKSGQPDVRDTHKWQTIAEIEEQIERVAPTDCSILLLGETGVGKEVYAKKIHEASGRRGRPFVVIQCPQLPKDRVDSELFGHAKGAFTGATEDYLGQIRPAEGGTVFLDEIGDLPPSSWSNLLRFLEVKEIRPMKGRTVVVDVRILAATNKPKDITEEAWYRLPSRLYLPPLRERREDIAALAAELFELAKKGGLGRKDLRFSQVEREGLGQAEYHWPGNIRQLKNAIEQAAIHHRNDRELTAKEVLDAAKAATKPT